MWLLSSLCHPAVVAHILSAVFLAIGVALLSVNYRRLMRFNPIYIAVICLMIAFGVAQHSQSHALLDKTYAFSPKLC
jgi:hypothetical protein